jgi:hypothetical protein
MKKFAYATAMLLVAGSAHADFTAKVKCDAKALPTQTYVGVGPTVLVPRRPPSPRRKKTGATP